MKVIILIIALFLLAQAFRSEQVVLIIVALAAFIYSAYSVNEDMRKRRAV